MRKRVGARAHPSLSLGFTMVELLLVIVVIGLLTIVALPIFLDFKHEARIASSQNYIHNLSSAIVTKKAQIMLKCNQPANVWPRREAILLNDITEGGDPNAHCTPQQIPNPEDRKFMDQEITNAPFNPSNSRRDIIYTNCSNLCTCTDVAGYLYNAQTGALGHPEVLKECLDLAIASASSTTSESGASESGTSSSTSSSAESIASSSISTSSESSYTSGNPGETCPGTYTGTSQYDLIEGQCYSTAVCHANGRTVYPGYPTSVVDYSNCVSGDCTPFVSYAWESGTYWLSSETGCVKYWNNCDESGQQSVGVSPEQCGYTCTGASGSAPTTSGATCVLN